MSLFSKIFSALLNRNSESGSDSKARIVAKTGVGHEQGDEANEEIQRQANEQRSKPKYQGTEQRQYETLMNIARSFPAQEVEADFRARGEDYLYLKYQRYLTTIKGEIEGLKGFVQKYGLKA